MDVSSLFWRQENHSSWSLQKLNEFASSNLPSLFKMIEFRQCSLPLFRFCDWSSLFSDNSPYCKCLNHLKFHSQWSRHQRHEICSKCSKTSKRQRFWRLKGRVLLPDRIWPQLKPIQNWQKSRNKKPTWWEISFELRVFAQESNFLGLEFVCLFFVSQKCRHWILVEDYGMHVCIYVYIHT